jgi:nucleoside-diphosphate-sugar epimerase
MRFDGLGLGAMQDSQLIVFGLGYAGAAIAQAAVAAGFTVIGTSRDPEGVPPMPGVRVIAFDMAGAALAQASHVVATAPPGGVAGEASDPVWATHGASLRAAQRLRWAGYLSTTGVYGDRQGGWVDETTPTAPGSPRAVRRVAAEQAWLALSGRIAVDLFRVAGIYGPGRSAFDDLRAGLSRRVSKPGHAFGRIHRDDIAGAVIAASMRHARTGGRVLHLSDDLPAESAEVIAAAAAMLGIDPPPLVPYVQAAPGMSEMARSFWAENRKVASAATQAMLGYRWRYPDYRSGLAGILANEHAKYTKQV